MEEVFLHPLERWEDTMSKVPQDSPPKHPTETGPAMRLLPHRLLDQHHCLNLGQNLDDPSSTSHLHLHQSHRLPNLSLVSSLVVDHHHYPSDKVYLFSEHYDDRPGESVYTQSGGYITPVRTHPKYCSAPTPSSQASVSQLTPY